MPIQYYSTIELKKQINYITISFKALYKLYDFVEKKLTKCEIFLKLLFFTDFF